PPCLSDVPEPTQVTILHNMPHDLTEPIPVLHDEERVSRAKHHLPESLHAVRSTRVENRNTACFECLGEPETVRCRWATTTPYHVGRLHQRIVFGSAYPILTIPETLGRNHRARAVRIRQ